jgi:hypothetical protein
MPGFHRKKKRSTGPNKNQQKVQRGREAQAEAQAAGTLSSRFPSIRNIKVHITLISTQGVVLNEIETPIGPNDPFLVSADCPGRCGSGLFDFTLPISQLLSQQQDHGLSESACAEPLYGGGADSCACVAKCEFQAEFIPN